MNIVDRSHYGQMVRKIDKNSNKINIQGDGFEIEVNLEKPLLVIQLISFEKDGHSGKFYKTIIEEGLQNSHHWNLLRDFQHVERIFQCFMNENYFSIDPRLAIIYVRLQQQVRINGFQRSRLEKHQIHLDQIQMSEIQKLFLKLMKMQETIKEIKQKNNFVSEEQKKKHSEEMEKLNNKYLYLRKKSNEQQKQIDFLMKKVGQNIRIQYRQKRELKKTKKSLKKEKEKAKLIRKQKEQNRNKLKVYAKQQSSSSNNSSSSSSAESSQSQQVKKPIKKIKKQKSMQQSIEEGQISGKNMRQIQQRRKIQQKTKKQIPNSIEVIVRKRQSETSEHKSHSKGIDLTKSLVFYQRDTFLVGSSDKNRIIFKGRENRWMQCVLNKQIIQQDEKVFDLRILKTKYKKIMIGIVSTTRMRDLSSYKTGKSITYRSEDSLIREGQFRKKIGRGFEQSSYVRVILELKKRKIQWKVGKTLDSLQSEAISFIPEHIINDGVFFNFQMYTEGDRIQIINY